MQPDPTIPIAAHAPAVPLATHAPPRKKRRTILGLAWIDALIAALVAAVVLGFCIVGLTFISDTLSRPTVRAPVPAEQVTRDNFNQMGQTLRSAQRVLGPSQMDHQGFGMATFSWHSKNSGCVISATYEMMDNGDGFIKSKTIIGN